MKAFNLTPIAEFEVLENPTLELIKGGALTGTTCISNFCKTNKGNCTENICNIHIDDCTGNNCGVNCSSYSIIPPGTGTNPDICKQVST